MRRWTHTEIDVMTSMFRAGKSVQVIGRKLNRDKDVVFRKIKRMGLDRPERAVSPDDVFNRDEDLSLLAIMENPLSMVRVTDFLRKPGCSIVRRMRELKA